VSLLGRGVVAIWHGLRDEGRLGFYEWHNQEHMPERAGIPGFLRGRRYVDRNVPAELFTLYETFDTDVLTSRAYLDRLNAPTPWTVESIRAFTNLSRALSEVVSSRSSGDGSVLRVVRFNVPAGDPATLRERLVRRLDAIALADGIVGVHVCATKLAASAIQSVEKQGQVQLQPAAWTVLIEFGAELRDVDTDHPLTADLLGDELGVTDVASNLFHLQYQVLGADLAKPGIAGSDMLPASSRLPGDAGQ
jgi:hypothetical protein